MTRKQVKAGLIGVGILGAAGIAAFFLLAPSDWEISFRGWLRGVILRG